MSFDVPFVRLFRVRVILLLPLCTSVSFLTTRCRDGIVHEALRCNETGIVVIEYPTIVLEMSHMFASTRVHSLPTLFVGFVSLILLFVFVVVSYYVS